MPRRKRQVSMMFDPGRRDYSKPSAAQIIGRRDRAVEIGAAIRELQVEVAGAQQVNTEAMDYFVGLYKGTIPLNIPANKRYVQFDARTAKPADIIHRAMGMLMTPLKSEYIAPVDQDEDQETAKNIMAHLDGAYEWLRRVHGQPFDEQSLFFQLLFGRGYIQQTHAPSYWSKRPDKAKDGESDGDFNRRVAGFKGYTGPPFYVESLDPRVVFPIPTNMGVTDWLKKYNVQRFDIEGALERAIGEPVALEYDPKVSTKVLGIKRGKDAIQYRNARDSMKGKPGLELPDQANDNYSGNCEYFEYIDGENVFYIVDDVVVHEVAHKGGIKVFPAGGLTTGFKEFEFQAVGILFAVRHEIPQFDFLRTLWINRAYIDVFPQLFAELGPDDDPIRDKEDKPEVWEIEPMTIKQIRGKLSNALKDATSGVDYRAAVEMMASDIDLATLAPLARGIAGAQQPGYSLNQLSQAMRSLWKPIIASRENQWGNAFEHYLWCVKNLVKEDVTVFAELPTDSGTVEGKYLTLDPDMIQDFYQVRARLQPELPIDRQGEMLSWMKAGDSGWATEREVSMNGFNEPNWRERRQRIERDRMRRVLFEPAAQAAMKLGNVMLEDQIIQSMGLDNLNAPFAQSLEQLRQGAGGTPTGGPPGTPGGAGPTPPATSGLGEGHGIPPTAGASQPSPTPAARM